jgi:sec-independent protein translocase protein TatC
MAATALRRPVRHEDRLTIVEHLDELRTRLIVCVVALVVSFGVCFWQNGNLLSVINHPLDKQTEKNIKKGYGPLGQTALAQQAIKRLAQSDLELSTVLSSPGSGLSPSARGAMRAHAAQVRDAIARLPKGTPSNKPVTLGVGEPFATTLTVSFLFALLAAMPIILFQAYAFIVPAFTPKERRVARPLLMMVPALFLCGVAFGYFLVLPAAVRFLQNFNADQFNVLVQARDYYHFAAITLLACGVVFQLPVGILALARVGVLTVAQLRHYRRYAIVVNAVIAMALPGTDPVSMLIELLPLLALYELSILLARLFVPKTAAAPAADDEDDDPDQPHLHAV